MITVDKSNPEEILIKIHINKQAVRDLRVIRVDAEEFANAIVNDDLKEFIKTFLMEID